jgi:hypothetical protein
MQPNGSRVVANIVLNFVGGTDQVGPVCGRRQGDSAIRLIWIRREIKIQSRTEPGDKFFYEGWYPSMIAIVSPKKHSFRAFFYFEIAKAKKSHLPLAGGFC